MRILEMKNTVYGRKGQYGTKYKSYIEFLLLTLHILKKQKAIIMIIFTSTFYMTVKKTKQNTKRWKVNLIHYQCRNMEISNMIHDNYKTCAITTL